MPPKRSLKLSALELKICYFPGRESTYARNRVITSGLREAGATVFDCSYPRRTFYRNIVSFFKFLRHKKNSDIILVGFMGQLVVPVVKLLTRKKIVFDALISLYQTLTSERKTISPHGIVAKMLRFLDQDACALADVVLLDTDQHINYFVNELEIEREKFQKVLVGSDISIMYPRQNQPERFLVHFHGEFQELHGVETIVEAAQLLPDIQFRMVGKGRLLPQCEELAKEQKINNIVFIDPVPYERLPKLIAEASVCLGIFGNTEKAKMVIPHKVYEALAMQKPVLTADTPAIRELLTSEKDVLLCKTADPRALADAILRIKECPSLRNLIAKNGFKVYMEKCTPQKIGAEILNISLSLLKT